MNAFRDAIKADLEDGDLPGAAIKVDGDELVWVLSHHQVGEWIQGLMQLHPESAERLFWVTENRYAAKVLGPFATADEAIENRVALEQRTGRSDFWVWQEGQS